MSVAIQVDSSYFDSYSYFDIHRDMLGDVPRTSTYREALECNPALMTGARVLDVGCGTGILSLFAARGGAAAVVGVDGSERMAATAAALAADNGFGKKPGDVDDSAARVRTVAGKVEDLAALPFEKFDVLVSEWMGCVAHHARAAVTTRRVCAACVASRGGCALGMTTVC